VPAILSERLLDGVAMILLSGVSLLIFAEILLYREVVNSTLVFILGAGVVLALIAGAIFLLRQKGIDQHATRLAAKVFKLSEEDAKDPKFAEAATRTFSLDAIAASTIIGLVYWGAQAAIYFVVVVSYGAPLSVETFVGAFFVYPASILIGTVTLIPFGLGPTDASLVFLGDLVFDLGHSELVSAAIVSRILIIVPPMVVGLAASASKPIRSQLAE
jgi:glycosyltransferase 2 family protein